MKLFNGEHSRLAFGLKRREAVRRRLQEIPRFWLVCRFTGRTGGTGSPLTDFREGFTQLLQLIFGYLCSHLPGERPVPSSLQQCALFSCWERNRKRDVKKNKDTIHFQSNSCAFRSDLTCRNNPLVTQNTVRLLCMRCKGLLSMQIKITALVLNWGKKEQVNAIACKMVHSEGHYRRHS